MFDKAIENNEVYSAAYYYKGKALAQLGSKAQSEQMFMQAKMLNASSAFSGVVSRYSMSDSVSALGKTEEAAFIGMGNAHSALGDKEEALKYYRQASTANPKSLTAHCLEAITLYELLKFREAIKILDKVLAQNAKYAPAYYYKGNAYYALGDNKTALEMYSHAIAIDSICAASHLNKGFALEALGRPEEARKCYETAIKLDEKNPMAYCAKGKLLSKNGQHSEAVKCFNLAHELLKQDAARVLSEENRSYIQKVLENREELLRRIEELSSIQILDELSCNQQEVETQQKLEASRQKAISEAVDSMELPIPPDFDISTLARNTWRELQKQEARLKKNMLEEIAKKADRAELEHVLEADAVAILKEKQMQEINSNPKLRKYFDTMLGTFNTHYTSAEGILGGQLVLDTSKAGITLVAHILSLMPFGGSIVGSGVEAVSYFVKGAELQKHALQLKKIAPDHHILHEIVEQIAMKIVLHPNKKAEILDDSAEETTRSWWGAIVEKAIKLKIKLEESFYGERFPTPPEKLANKDACDLIKKLLTGEIKLDEGDDVVMVFARSMIPDIVFVELAPPPRPPQLDPIKRLLLELSLSLENCDNGEKAITEISDRITKSIVVDRLTALGYTVVNRCNGEPCVKFKMENVAYLERSKVMLLTHINYNNPLLNNPELVQEFTAKYGDKKYGRLLNLTSELARDNRADLDDICHSDNACEALAMLLGETPVQII